MKPWRGDILCGMAKDCGLYSPLIVGRFRRNQRTPLSKDVEMNTPPSKAGINSERNARKAFAALRLGIPNQHTKILVAPVACILTAFDSGLRFLLILSSVAGRWHEWSSLHRSLMS